LEVAGQELAAAQAVFAKAKATRLEIAEKPFADFAAS